MTSSSYVQSFNRCEGHPYECYANQILHIAICFRFSMTWLFLFEGIFNAGRHFFVHVWYKLKSVHYASTNKHLVCSFFFSPVSFVLIGASLYNEIRLKHPWKRIVDVSGGKTCSFVSWNERASVWENILRAVTLQWPLCRSHGRFRLPSPIKVPRLHLPVTPVQTGRWWTVFTPLITWSVNYIIAASSWHWFFL